MITDLSAQKIPRKKVTISDFKARCTEYIREIEKGDEIIEITRHGKIVAIAKAPGDDEPSHPEDQSLKNLTGSLRGTATFSDDYDPHHASAPMVTAGHPSKMDQNSPHHS